MIESEIVASGSVKGVLTGKHYNRCIRAHKVVFEAMQRLRFLAFYESLPDNEAEELSSFSVDLLDSIDETLPEFCSTDDRFIAWKEAFDSFVKKRSEENPTFLFWSTYIDMILLLLLFVRATRTSNWQLHLSVLRSMIPWFFATDRVNYSRYGPCYWLEMSLLESTHPCKFFNEVSVCIYVHIFIAFTKRMNQERTMLYQKG